MPVLWGEGQPLGGLRCWGFHTGSPGLGVCSCVLAPRPSNTPRVPRCDSDGLMYLTTQRLPLFQDAASHLCHQLCDQGAGVRGAAVQLGDSSLVLAVTLTRLCGGVQPSGP